MSKSFFIISTKLSAHLCFSFKKNKTQMKSRALHDVLGGCQNFVSGRNQAVYISVLKANSSSHISHSVYIMHVMDTL